MDDKNELNDLLLGNQKESSSSRKFFLIAAGVLLLFFIIIGIMKFMGASETKQPLPITSTEQVKKLPPVASPVQNEANGPVAPAALNTNTTATADDKLNAIVKKLQQDAQKEASAQPAQAAQTAQPTPSAPAMQPKVEQVPVVSVKQESAPAPQKQSVKTTVVTVPIKTASEQPQPKADLVKETQKKEDIKTAFKDATKNVVKQKQPAKQVVATPKKAEANKSEAASGTYYIQVGYFENEKSTKGLSDKISAAGFQSTTRAAIKNDKNITKVWVGPFDSKDSATKALPKVREQIKNDAFIIKG
ncbi:MAG: SPOR domain-containing protein [Campylobacteraceae bacterium]|jgi:DedD protein|nr:SPOR domain-containing protein [Campylobacteraceae bacterium]